MLVMNVQTQEQADGACQSMTVRPLVISFVEHTAQPSSRRRSWPPVLA